MLIFSLTKQNYEPSNFSRIQHFENMSKRRNKSNDKLNLLEICLKFRIISYQCRQLNKWFVDKGHLETNKILLYL